MKDENAEIHVFCATSDLIHNVVKRTKNKNSEIKLFKIELSIYYDIVDVLIKSLTRAEIKRAEKYYHNHDKNRFIICRSILKFLLAELKQLPISEIQFETTSNHKPYFPLDKSLFFNVAHSRNYALIAIGSCELGVDVEFIDNHFEYNEVKNQVFNKKEIDFIDNSHNGRYEFYKFWTRKEAIVKAIGKGIDADIVNICVTDGIHSVPRAIVGDLKTITAFSFNINDDYVGSLAYTEAIHDIDRIVFYHSPTPEELSSLL